MFIIDDTTYHSKSYNERVRFLVLHYTAGNFKASINALVEGSVSAHYLVPDPKDETYKLANFSDVRIFQLVREKARAWHAGVSAWEDRTNLNDNSIGIEIVYTPTLNNKGGYNFPDFNSDQISAVIQIAKNILLRYPDITPVRVIGHSDIAYTRKIDPGPKFPWEMLSQQGIGAWWNDNSANTFISYQKNLDKCSYALPDEGDIKQLFKLYGYSVPPNLSAQDYQNLIKAFQMHFRPSLYNGEMDKETCAILLTLCQKYKPQCADYLENITQNQTKPTSSAASTNKGVLNTVIKTFKNGINEEMKLLNDWASNFLSFLSQKTTFFTNFLHYDLPVNTLALSESEAQILSVLLRASLEKNLQGEIDIEKEWEHLNCLERLIYKKLYCSNVSGALNVINNYLDNFFDKNSSKLQVPKKLELINKEIIACVKQFLKIDNSSLTSQITQSKLSQTSFFKPMPDYLPKQMSDMSYSINLLA